MGFGFFNQQSTIQGQRYRKHRPTLKPILRRYRPPMAINNIMADGKAHTEAHPLFPGVKRIKDMLQILFWNPGAVIGDVDHHMTLSEIGFYAYLPAVGTTHLAPFGFGYACHGLYGIVKEIQKYVVQLLR